MNYVESILSKLKPFVLELESKYDKILNTEYDGDVTKIITNTFNEKTNFFVQLGSDIENLKLICDGISTTYVVTKSDLLLVNEMYKKYKSLGDL